jgi:hypothetical protein
MCNGVPHSFNIILNRSYITQGLRGKNTEVLTYSGPANTPQLKNQKAAKRRAAGCVDGYCQNLIAEALKKDPTNTAVKELNSCDEVCQLFQSCYAFIDIARSIHLPVAMRVDLPEIGSYGRSIAFRANKIRIKANSFRTTESG